MRDDQYIRLQQLEEKLTDQFLTEADPENWTGSGVLPMELSQQQRGDRYWCKKNAVATISLTIRIGSLIGMVQRAGGGTTPASGEGEGDAAAGLLTAELDADVAAAESEAKKLLAKIERRGKAKTPQ